MIALLTACLFFCNPCAHAELHQQKGARKLCSATLNFAAEFDRHIIPGRSFFHNDRHKPHKLFLLLLLLLLLWLRLLLLLLLPRPLPLPLRLTLQPRPLPLTLPLPPRPLPFPLLLSAAAAAATTTKSLIIITVLFLFKNFIILSTTLILRYLIYSKYITFKLKIL